MTERRLNQKKFFSQEETQQIIHALQQAEKNTSGEIRIHLAKKVRGNILTHARKVFQQIGMTRTAQRNGVLVFIALKNKTFAILGDTGIHEKVGDTFWNDICSHLETDFKNNRFSEGLCTALQTIGMQLKKYFPYQANDINELSDDLSYE